MCSDVEFFVNLIYITEFMNKLFDKDFNKYLKCIELTQEWENFNSVQDIVNLNSSYINEAIKEILEKEKFIKLVRENTQIDIEIIKKMSI